MTWTPLTRESLDVMLADRLAQFDEEVRAQWDRIRIQPVKWQCHPHGDLGGGFWVVAVMGEQVLWYNDIEDGFNRSAFTTRGVIDDYWCNQDEFTDILRKFAAESAERVWRRGDLSTDVPTALMGAGQITSHQPMYWELLPTGAAKYRVYFEDGTETLLDGHTYSRMELIDKHPILEHYAQDWAMLDIGSAPADPVRVASRLTAALEEHTGGWRHFSQYSNGPAEQLLAGSYGLLMRAPRTYVDLALEILRQEKVRCSAIADQRARLGYRALILNRSYVIARRFGFEVRNPTQALSAE